MEEDEYKKLPVEDRCVHKLWKARVNGYEEVTKLFRQIDDEKSPEFGKYLGLIKKFVVDSNALGQEKGLEAALAFVENYAHAGKTVGEVISGIVAKCIAAPKTRTRELALQVTLMYIEIEKQDVVLEELMKGMDVKNPKIISACINACTTALHEFGVKVFTIKPLVKKIPTLFADRDKAVRDEARLLAIEMYKWIGPTLRSQLNNLQPLQITELETEFAKIEGHKAVPARFLRSQQEKQAKLAVETVDGNVCEEDEEDELPVQLDPYDLADPVNILSNLPKDFFEKVEAKKWQERKEALENLENLVKSPKLENGDYGDLVRALRKIIQKDSNVVVVTTAAKCLTGLANGLKKRFQTYASACVPVLLEKFKEKKQTVVVAVRDAIDAVFLTTTIENILDDVLEALNNKNPSVKSETALFLARAFTKTLPTALNKKLLKALSSGLIKIINEPDPTVRDSSSEAVGTLMKLVGEKAISPFLVELEKDNLKMTKIKECCEKAVITVKVPGANKKERPTTAPVKSLSKDPAQNVNKQAKRPITAAKKKPTEISSGSATIVKSKSSKSIKSVKPIERELSDDEVSDLVADILSSEILSGLTDSNWKARLSSAEQVLASIQEMDNALVPVQAIVKTVNKKPGLKDTNFQVLKARFDVVKFLATNCVFSVTSADCCLTDITEKLGDIKNGTAAAETLTAIAEATSLNHVSTCVMEFAHSQKSPKVLQEALNWLCTAIKEFGFANLNTKTIIEHTKKALGSTNPSVRGSAISLAGVLYLYMGPLLHTFFENEKPLLREQINAEFDKYENEKPPAPIRGISNSKMNTSNQEEDEEEYSGDAVPINVQDLLPRVDISVQITEGLINELSDKNWKVRNEALTKLNSMITEAKLIKPNLSDLPQALAHRLIDSNSKIAQTAFSICEAIANAMGPPCRSLIRVLFPAMLQGLGDGKTWIRSSALACMNTFVEQCGYKEFFEAEMISDALKTGSPMLRCEVWNWLAENLPKIKQVPKEELLLCVPHLYSNLEDRNADVRKNAQEAVLGIMIHLSYESMVKQTEKLKPGSKSVVMAALDKARPNLPEKPLPAKKQAASSKGKAEKTIKGGAPSSKNSAKVKVNGGATNKQPTVVRKKDDDIDTSPLLVVNNMKHQRTIDESKLRVLKWNFTTPREEFVELLKEQMTNANVNKTLMTNMFHSDFRYHIKAIESLMEDLPNNGQALISNLDLILKWLTLRFFDTNPSVLLKGLEYLHSVFNMLIENKYHMLENEASSFIPYLILKVGDPKDTVRNGVRSLFRQICKVYAVSKLFSYIMEGLKSKNARQRAECLEVLGSIIEDFGINVCLPSPGACLKEIAKQISDRDNAVRNAALNCVVQAYYIVGDKVYKMVGQISDKDMSLLEERIKRANKRPIAPPKTTQIETPVLSVSGSPHRLSTAESSPVKIINNEDNDPMDQEERQEEFDDDDLPQIALPPQVVQEPEEVSGPYRLDPEFLKELEGIKTSVVPMPKLLKFDLDFLKEDIIMPTLADTKEKRAKIMPLSPPKPILPTQTFSKASLLQRQPIQVAQDMSLEKIINQIGNPDIATALQGIEQMQEILQSSKGNMIVNYEDHFMITVTQQLKLLSNQDPTINAPVARIYRAILTLIDLFYSNKMLGQKISTDVLKDLMYQFILLIAEAKLSNCPNGDSYIRVVNIHCVKAIERSDHTNIICALIKLLHFCVTNAPPRFTDLVMKCLWRVIKIMKNWADEIDYDSVLLEIHIFLKEFPSSWWKNQPSDTALRTIKTILHSMAKMKGGALMLHLGKIPNTNDSEMESYILRVLKSLKIEEIKQVPLKTDSGRSLSRTTHTQLTEIFQKIGNKAETKEGLNLLYDFMQQHSEADIDPFLKRSSQFFQEYIQKSLKEIEIARKSPLAGVNLENKETLSELSIPEGSDEEKRRPEYWRKRLDMWNKLWDEKMKNFHKNPNE